MRRVGGEGWVCVGIMTWNAGGGGWEQRVRRGEEVSPMGGAEGHSSISVSNWTVGLDEFFAV
jgi:hypothetical protein